MNIRLKTGNPDISLIEDVLKGDDDVVVADNHDFCHVWAPLGEARAEKLKRVAESKGWRVSHATDTLVCYRVELEANEVFLALATG